MFSCDRHRDQLLAPRELLDRERAVIADRTERERRALAGQGWNLPEPLATGARALELLHRDVTVSQTVQ